MGCYLRKTPFAGILNSTMRNNSGPMGAEPGKVINYEFFVLPNHFSKQKKVSTQRGHLFVKISLEIHCELNSVVAVCVIIYHFSLYDSDRRNRL